MYAFKTHIQLYVIYSVPTLVFNTCFDFTLNSVNVQSEAIHKTKNHSEINNIITVLHFSLVLLLLWIFFQICVSCLSVILSIIVHTCWERAELLALLYVMFSCVFVTFPYGDLGQVWYLIVYSPYLYLLSYFV